MQAFFVSLLLLLTGCYTYAPVPGMTLGRGTAVRARLAAPSDFRLTELTANGVVTIDGEVVRQDTGELVVSALWLRSQTGYEFPAAGETVTIPAERLAGIEQKRFSVARSAMVAGAGVLASVLFVAAFGTDGFGGGGGGDGTDPQ